MDVHHNGCCFSQRNNVALLWVWTSGGVPQGNSDSRLWFVDIEFQISEKGEVDVPNVLESENQEVGELDLSVINVDQSGDWSGDGHLETKDVTETRDLAETPPQFETESFIPQSTDAQNQSIVEDVPKIGSEPFIKQLPPCHTRGIPKPTYVPELSSKVKYAMSHYVSNHHMSKSNQSFVNQLSTVYIPNCVQEALANPSWKNTMNEDEVSAKKWNLGTRWLSTREETNRVPMDFMLWSTKQMARLNALKQDKWQKDIPKPTGLTTQRRLHL